MKKIKFFIKYINPSNVLEVLRNSEKTFLEKIQVLLPIPIVILIIGLASYQTPTYDSEGNKLNVNKSTTDGMFNYLTTRKFQVDSNLSEDFMIYEFLNDSTYTYTLLNKRSEKITLQQVGEFSIGKAKYLGGEGEFIYVKTRSKQSAFDDAWGWSLMVWNDDYLAELMPNEWEGFDSYGPRVDKFKVDWIDEWKKFRELK